VLQVSSKRKFKFLRRGKDKKIKVDQSRTFFIRKKLDKVIVIIY